MTFDPTEKSGVTSWHVSNVLGRHRTTQELRVDTERRNVIVSETWSRRGDGVFARERDREQGPRQEEDGADQALPGRPPGRLAARHSSGHPAVLHIPHSNKQNSVLMYYLGEQRDGRGAAGQGLVGAVFLLPRSLLAVSLPRKHSVAPPTPRFAYDHIASFGVYPELLRRSVST